MTITQDIQLEIWYFFDFFYLIVGIKPQLSHWLSWVKEIVWTVLNVFLIEPSWEYK